MNFAIHLNHPHQRLECYDINPTLDRSRNWYCRYSEQITLQDLPLFKQRSLYFSSDMYTAYRDMSITLNDKPC